MTQELARFETRGRLWLWHSAILECQRLLELEARATAAADSERTRAIEENHSAALNEFTRAQPDYEPGKLKMSHVVAFRKQHPEEFPCFDDCMATREACIMLATVFFCQIFNDGYSATGRAAANNRKFREHHLASIVSKVFPSQEDQTQFEALSDQLKSARDKMIGHADAESFNIVHGDALSSMKLYVNAIKGINLEYWRSILPPLRHAILDHANQPAA